MTSSTEDEKLIEADYDFDVPDQLESVLEDLFTSLQDKVSLSRDAKPLRALTIQQ